ncbi:MAG: diguanylate cyclase [Planctomycetaceae bacterium]
MSSQTNLAGYDSTQTYRWNYDHAPERPDPPEPAAEIPGNWTFCGLPVESPLGIPAGPLLNGKWVLFYADLGFDVLTYKTVRSIARECYPLPNLQPVDVETMTGQEADVKSIDEMRGSWAVSFGMPSAVPDIWRADIEQTRTLLSPEKILSVSVVGSVQPNWTLEDLADDYAQCAKWAVESGADCIETNFSCPNVSTCDGQLYQQPESAAVVCERVRAAIGETPYIIKIGRVTNREEAEKLVEATSPYVNAYAMTNSVATRVRSSAGDLLFNGEPRGICGAATRNASIEMTKLFAEVLSSRSLSCSLIGVGGASSAEHVREYLQAGAEAVHIATAAMIDPRIGLKIREDLARSFGSSIL